MIVSCHDCWSDAEADHFIFFDTIISRRLSSDKKLRSDVKKFIDDNFEKIKSGKFSDLKLLAEQFDALIKPSSRRAIKSIKSGLASIFNYDSFSRKQNEKWGAYKLCQKCKIKTCPYCNMSFAHTLYETNGAIRPELDHYIDKASYPFLSLSLYNLVPTCHTCNSSLKGRKNFLTYEHLHPLLDDEVIRFELSKGLIEVHMGEDIHQSEINVCTPCKKSKRSAATFLISERYNLIKSEIIEIADFFAKPNGIFDFGENVEAYEQIRSGIMRGVTEENYHNRIMGKIILDIAEQFKPVAVTT